LQIFYTFLSIYFPFVTGEATTSQSDAVQSAPADADQGKALAADGSKTIPSTFDNQGTAPTAEYSNTILASTESGLTSNNAITDSNQSATNLELASSTQSTLKGSVNKTSTTIKVKKYDFI
jgi:hypothetical protein